MLCPLNETKSDGRICSARAARSTLLSIVFGFVSLSYKETLVMIGEEIEEEKEEGDEETGGEEEEISG